MAEGKHSRVSRWGVRAAYTLVELLMVLAIIGTLMALLLVACFSALRFVEDARAKVSLQMMEFAAASGEPLHVPSPPPLKAPNPAPYVPDHHLIQFHDFVRNPKAEARKIAAAHGGEVLGVYDTKRLKACRLRIKNFNTKRLYANASVKIAEQEPRRYLCKDMTPTGVKRIINKRRRQKGVDPATLGLPRAPRVRLIRDGSNKSCIVAVLDTGVDETHPELNVTRTLTFGAIGPHDATDNGGHGTHVAGIIGARKNGQGVVGVCPDVEIWSIDLFGAGGANGDFFAAYDFVIENADKIRVVNMSYSGARSSTENNFIDACVDAGVIMVCAAGNSNINAANRSPASASKVVCVAALADSDGKPRGKGPATNFGEDDTLATFSNFGRTVDCLGPGVNIISTFPGGAYVSYSGTSMASPHVAGLLAIHCASVTKTEPPRLATGLEIVAMLCRKRGGCELFNARGREYPYPLLTLP